MGSERTGTNVRIIRSIKGMYRTYFEENIVNTRGKLVEQHNLIHVVIGFNWVNCFRLQT